MRTKIKDDHNPTTTKDWTCLVGDLDGSTTWKSDRNVGDKPRLVLTLAIDGRYHEPFNKLEEFIQSV